MTPPPTPKRIPASKTGKKAPSTRKVGSKPKAKAKAPDAPAKPNAVPDKPSTEKSPVPQKAKGTAAAAGKTAPVRHPIGIRRLDELLGGGLRLGSFTLLYGPPFLGKEYLARLSMVHAIRSGVPAILIHTDQTTDEAMEHLRAIDPIVDEAAASGLLQFVDCYSRPIEADESPGANIQYVDGPMDLNGITFALNEAQRAVQSISEHHVVVIDSLSTMIAYANASTAFRFLQVLLGKGRRIGATSIVLMGQGMHAEADVQMFRHLMNGSIEVRDHSGKPQLKVLGIGNQDGLGWIDYRFSNGRLQLTGSFAPGRIR